MSDQPPTSPSPPSPGDHHDAVRRLLDETWDLPAGALTQLAAAAGAVLGAASAKLLIVDYALASLQELGDDGPIGQPQPVDGTRAGLSFSRGEVIVSEDAPVKVWVPLTEGTERLGVLELTHPSWSDELHDAATAVARLLVLVIVSKRRYTDVALRSRRTQPLSLAAEMQWDLLPPLTGATDEVSVSGILEPAYSIGGDSFDFALNRDRVEFAIVDAVGHGMSAVLLTVATINSLRNARREGADLSTAYKDTGSVIEQQFGEARFVTGQLGSLRHDTGELTWLNAGHPLPLLVRDGTYIGELACQPSYPMGLDGQVREVATENLQPGDRVLFFTDGVTETRSVGGDQFGLPRLADFLVRATLDQVSAAETVRRLAASIMSFTGADLNDDATLLLVEYRGQQ